MKFIKNIAYLIVATVLLVSCNSNDDDFYNSVYLRGTGFVVIETKPNYVVGDKLFIRSSVPRFLTEDNYAEKLDVYKTSGYSNALNFSYVIERRNETSNEWEVVQFNPKQLDIQKGNAAASNFYIDAKATYNVTTEEFEFLGGFPLFQKGDYRLNFNGDENSHEVGLVSDSGTNKLNVIIFSKTANLNAEGFYYFTVN